jgi:hypothetical protein
MKEKIWRAYPLRVEFWLTMQDFTYDPTLYETFTDRDDCPLGEDCTVEGDGGAIAEKKMPWESDIQD